ncbi:MAG: twin-arginine translocase TatA/TatE family subunit [Alphaproteobacteria bacterium]|nr:twin-arginine translocase TatA/TatE family subunit [Alphaproteobacteria bacterium]
MFGISFSESILIFLVLLIAVGPKQLPTVSRNFAILYKKINLFVRQLKQSIDDSLYDLDSIKQDYSDKKIEENKDDKTD